ncbi:MAG TPA: ABC transporter ATP-binding protein [Candidatus Krumholzibacteriaceae bacterium]|nr:ABC transporter ATP-binding protein [Candidatus Krumholzibacteriaceae bacterium]
MQISIEGLNKTYRGGHKALSGLTLKINNGIFGLLGPNGAGKTTLMRILVTLIKPTSGNVTIDGYDLAENRKEIRSMIGYLPQQFQSFPKLKTWEFLDYSAELGGVRSKKTRMKMVDRLLEQVGLYDSRDKRAAKLSGGMKRRLGIAQALAGNPRILIVDEPTTGLDPEERIRFRNLLSEMSEKDMIIILSTHIVGDISSTCLDMALLNSGRLAFSGAPEELIEMAKGHTWKINATDSELEQIKQRYSVISTFPSVNGWEVHLVADELERLSGETLEPGLEEAYVYFLEHYTNPDYEKF